MSWPWLVFKLPVLSNVVIHVKPTGYDKLGRCVRMLSSAEKFRKRDLRIRHKKDLAFRMVADQTQKQRAADEDQEGKGNASQRSREDADLVGGSSQLKR